jgi:hypothetical protein
VEKGRGTRGNMEGAYRCVMSVSLPSRRRSTHTANSERKEAAASSTMTESG